MNPPIKYKKKKINKIGLCQIKEYVHVGIKKVVYTNPPHV